MTTVIVDTRTRAIGSDNMATTNEGGVSVYCKKLYRIRKGPHKGDICGSVGNEGPFFLFLDLYEAGHLDEPPPPGDIGSYIDTLEDHEAFEAVILKANGELWVADKWMRPYKLEAEFYASGSGGPFAYGAMMHGASILSAIRVACECDPHSSLMGRKAQVVTLRKES